MKKKFTMLLATFLTFVGVAMAGVTDLPQMSKEGDIKWYTIRNTRSTSGQYLYWTENGVKDANAKKLSSLFYFTGTAEECYIHNAATNLLFTGVGAWNETGVKCKISVTPFGDGTTGLAIEFSGTALNESNTGNGYTTWGAADEGSVFVIEEANVAQMAADYKTAAQKALDMIRFLGVDDEKAAINAIEANIDAFAAVDAIVNGVAQYVAFRNGETNTGSVRYNNYLAAYMPNSKGHGTETFNHLYGIWSLKYSGEGSFYIYNVNQKVYLGDPNSKGALTETPNSAYTFEVIEDNKVEFKSGDQTLHMNNHDGNGTVSLGNALTNYDSDDVASRWYVVTDFTFVVDIESLKGNAIGELTELAKLSFIYSTAEQAIAKINSLKPAKNNLKELEDAAEQIEAIVAKCKTDAYQALNNKFFTINTPARTNGGYMQMTTSKVVGTASVTGPANIWQFIYNDNGAFYIYNPYINKYLCEPADQNSYDVSITSELSNAGAYTFVISTTDNNNDGAVVKLTSNDKSVHMDGSSNLVRWDDGAASEWSIAEFGLKDFKEVVTAEIDELLKLSAIYPDATHIKTEIQKTENSNIIEGCLAINNILENYRKSIDGKSMKFRVDGRGSRFLGYNKTNYRIETQVLGFDDVYWTLKYVGNGYFKLYNPVHKVWLGAPDGAKKKNDDDTETSYTPGLANEAEASLYKLEVKGDNVVLLVTENGKVAHANGGHVITDYWNKEDHASWWTIIDAGTFQMTYDEYKEFLVEKSEMMKSLVDYAKQLQDEYGLVKEGNKIAVVVNHPGELGNGDCQPSSNLLDGANDSYVHSSYDDATMNTVDNHYIEVELSAATRNIFCYFSKRNDNNRPAVINVYAGNSAEEITTLVGTLNMPESDDNSVQSYFSEGIDLGAEYSHLRFVVTQTNTGTKFFTLSEFYVLPINDDTRNIAELTSASITETNTSERIENAQGYLNMLKNASDFPEVKKILDDNKENHAVTPGLGQYPTVAYKALKDALKSADATEESLNEAIAVFKSSKNLPVFTIDGVVDYAVGKSIYDNPKSVNDKGNTHYFKATNNYDKTMWWALDMTTASLDNVGKDGITVGITNVGTGASFWNTSTIKITETSENDGNGIVDDGIFLFYTTGNDTPIHAQSDGALITRWDSKGADSGSAWKFSYVGNTYELNQLTDEYLAALEGLYATVTTNMYLFYAQSGEGLGQYQGYLSVVQEALVNGGNTVSLPLYDLVNEIKAGTVTLDIINGYKSAIEDTELTINLPAEGYYRIYGANSNVSLAGQYITGHTNKDGGRIALTNDADASTIYYYADGKLQAYQSGKYIGLNSGYYVFATSKDDETHPASAIEFAASSYVAGAYTIKSADRYLHYKVYNGAVEIDRCSEEESANDSWYLEEVQKERITYIYKSGDKEAARKVVEEFAGMPYPEPKVVSPFGFTVADGVYDGNVSEGEATKEIACTLDLPFEYADSYENIGDKWYFLKFHANDNNYLYYANDSEVLDATKTQIDRTDIKAYAWAFVGDPINGFRLVNKKANDNADVVKGVKATSAGAVVAEGGDVLKLTPSTYGTNGFFMEAPSGDNTQRFNKQGGKVVYWSDADAGSTFMVSAVSELATLIAEAEKLKTTVDGNKGNKIGEYSEETASILATAIENAKAKGDAATAADVEALQAVLDATKVIYPEVGKYYQFHSAMGFAETKAVYSGNGEPCWKTLDNDDKSFCWKAVATADGGIAFQNAIDKKYLNGNAIQSGAWTVSDTPENIGLKILSKEESAKGYQYGIVLNGWQMHANWHGGGSGTGSNIVSWNTNANDASAWYIVQTELYDIVYVFKCDDVTIDKYSQFAVLEEGAAYPAVQVPALPYGVSTNATTPEGNVTESKTFEFTLTVDKNLPFKAVAEGTPENWYYVQMHAHPDYGFYISANSNNNLVWYGAIEEAAKYVDTNANLNNYLWGFVGNMWDGFKMVNKAGKAVNSSGSGDVAVGDLNAATAFMAWNSQANGDWFCLKHPEKEQYLNLNVAYSTIQHWNENDNGSSLLVTEYKEYPLSVSAAGYSTYYSDDRLSIPAEVEAYVVSEIDITDGSGSVTLQQVEGVLPAHTGVILKNTGNYKFVTSAAKPADIDANYLKGTTTNTLITPEDGTICYVLANGTKGIGLYKASLNMTAEGEDVGKGNGTAFLNNANKVYLPVPVSGQQGAPSLTFRFGTSEVESMDVVATDEVIIYDLMGRRVVKMDKGIYIVNGKKVLVK